MTLLTKIEANRQESIVGAKYTTVLLVLGAYHSDAWGTYIRDHAVASADTNPKLSSQNCDPSAGRIPWI
jgi:hypothetical protein